MSYKVTGVIPTPMHSAIPHYSHEASTYPTIRPYPIGEAGRTVSVTTEDEAVAKSLKSIFQNVFVKVKTEVIE